MPAPKRKPKIDCSRSYCRERLAPPAKFDPRSFRTKTLAGGRKLVVGCPKGKWNAKARTCAVGVRAQSLLRPYSNRKCQIACPVRKRRRK
jgi:hypothetical protein